MGFLCTFKIKIEHQILESGSTKKNSDHIQINIKMPTPIQEHPASSKVPNQDIQDMDVPYTFKFKIESQNCSSPSKEKLSCLGEHYYHKILLLLVVVVVVPWLLPVSHLLPRPTEKNQLLGPHKRYWSEILRICSNSPNLIFGLVLVNPIGSSNWHS